MRTALGCRSATLPGTYPQDAQLDFRIATRPESLDLLSMMTNDIRVATLSGGAFSYAERVPRQFPQHLWTLGEPHVPDANYAAELFRVTSIVASSTFMNSLLWGASVIPIGM